MESVSGREILSIKIYFSLSYFLAILFIFASIPVQNYGELILLRNSTNGDKRSLTCLTEDDDAALIWNYNFPPIQGNSSQNGFTDFEPKKPSSYTNKCAVWNSIQCLARWANTTGWSDVNSVEKPMRPVLDYRWEGFREFVFEKNRTTEVHQHVRQLRATTETVVFSIRGLRAVSIFLCETSMPKNYGQCFKIVLGSSSNKQSEIWTCPTEKSCKKVANVSDSNGGVLAVYAWRTFTLKWNSSEKIVEIFKDTDPENEPFLRGKLDIWPNVHHILVDTELIARVRFHFYDYYMTERNSSLLYSEEFKHEGKTFCVELQVGLCSECKLQVDVVETASRRSMFPHIETIDGNENSIYNNLLTWRSVKLNVTVPFEKFGLRIKTILKGNGSGKWAIHNFRMCKPVDSLRESTLTTDREKLNTLTWPLVSCQKLSHFKPELVDSNSQGTIEDKSQLELLVNKWSTSCGSSCKKLGKEWSICNPTGCTCDRGFYGEDCNKNCTQGYYGFNCTDKCGACKNGCDTKTGACSDGCKREDLPLPFCKRETSVPEKITDIQNLTANSISDTKVTLQWHPAKSRSNQTVGYKVLIKIDKLIGCYDLKKLTPPLADIHKAVSVTKVSFDSLHPYAIYNATVTPYTTIYGTPKTVDFKTFPTNISTSSVSNFRLSQDNKTLEWDDPVDCTTITGPTEWKKFIITDVSKSVNHTITRKIASKHFELKNLVKLSPYTEYRVRIHVIGDKQGTVNSTCYRELEGRTPPTKPNSVKNLTIYDADPDTNTFSLKWIEPQPANGEIESYFVIIKGSKTIKHNKTVRVLKKEQSYDLKGNYVWFRNLTLPPNFIRNNPEIVVYAKNANVTESGIPSNVTFVPKSCFKVPSQPRNLTASHEDHGIVKLQWSHPLISYTKILRFKILAIVLDTRLSENITQRFSFDYVVLKKYESYTKKLYLPTSTSYRISVMAVIANNLTSSRVEVNTTVSDGVAFDGELNITRNGTLTNLIVPGVTNKTRTTMVSVMVEGFLKCNGTPLPSLVLTTYKPENHKPKLLKIKANDLKGNASNCSVDLAKNWKFRVVAKDSNSAMLAALMIVPMTLAEDKPQNLVWFIVSAIIIIAICSAIIFCIWHLKRKRLRARESYTEMVPLSQRKPNTKKSREKLTSSCNRQSSTPPPSNYEIENRLSNHVYAVPFVLESNSVSTTCFEEYAKDSAFNEVLISQYGLFPRGLVRPCNYGRLPKNMPKNRNKNLIAYDESRVILDKIPGDQYSDYINANYIQGYGETTAYIATQGPKPNTINDFWRMISQKKVLVICMLTNIVENGKKMCEKYWPDVKTEEKYGNITVFNTDEQVFADYTFRTFKLNYKNQETRTVTHLHYTGWPDNNVPMYPQSLVSYLKKLAEILDGHGPMVVHCSAGDGRTGTIILCDMCIRQGIEDGKIEVSDVTKRMHSSRANMIDNPQQYVFAHVVIAESIMSIPTQIPCTNVFPSKIISLKKQLTAHVHRLNMSVWQERALHSLSSQQGRISLSMTRNKLPELIEDSVEVDIYEQFSDLDRDTNYINAVPVDGVRLKNQYLSSQLPSPAGLPDFWRFIAEKNIELVIILQCPNTNDPMFCDVMPGDSILVPVPYMQVETEMHVNEDELFTIDKLLLTDTSEEKPRLQSVSVIKCNGWKCGRTEKLPSTNALVSLWRAAENIKREQGMTLVLCQDGVKGCGLYLALSFLLERMTVERECDVISAVRAVRRSRPEFVQSMQQFEYLYDAAMNYFECFQTYANFC